MRAAGYDYPVIKGMAAKVIHHFKGRANDMVAGAIDELRFAPKFSLGGSKDLPSVCHLDDEEINSGPIRLPFDLMAIETTSNEDDGDYECVFLYKRASASEVQIYAFMRKPGEGDWNVVASWCLIEVGQGGTHHQRIVSEEYVENDQQRAAVYVAAKAAKVVLQALNALIECNNVVVETVPAPKPQAGQKLGKRKRELLQFEYRILTIKGRRSYEKHGEASHSSPRLHLRRGHIRKLPTGKTTWVRNCAVGSGKRGMVQHDYGFDVRQ